MIKRIALSKWKIFTSIGAIIIISVFFIGIYNTPTQKINRQISLGFKYLENQQYEEAIVVFANIISIDENCIEAYAGIVNAYEKIGDEKALQKSINDALVIVNKLDEQQISKKGKFVKIIKEAEENINQKNKEDKNVFDGKEEPLEASSEDIEKLLKQQEFILAVAEAGGYNWLDLKKDDFMFWTNVFFHYFGDEEISSFLPIETAGIQNMEHIDPKKYAPWESYLAASTSELDWILENVFQIPQNLYKTIDIKDGEDFFYRDEKNYCIVVDGIGLSLVDNSWISSQEKLENGHYQMVIVIDNSVWGDELKEIIVEVSLKEYKGEKYWSFWKIGKIDSTNIEITNNNDDIDMNYISEQLDLLEVSAGNRYTSLNSASVDVVGIIKERVYEQDANVGGANQIYYVIVFEEPVEISFEDVEGYIYTETYNEIQIDSSAAIFDNKKVACRIKGWNSLIGALSEWVVPGAIFCLE